jgi:hypothetical protein
VLYKDKRLWLEYPEDHDFNEKLGPKLLFLIGIDWYVYNQRPIRPSARRQTFDIVKTYHKTFNITFYLTYWQFHASFKICKMPYTTHAEYLTWRKHDAKGNS